SYAATVWPPRVSRVTILSPIRPNPTKPISIRAVPCPVSRVPCPVSLVPCPRVPQSLHGAQPGEQSGGKLPYCRRLWRAQIDQHRAPFRRVERREIAQRLRALQRAER